MISRIALGELRVGMYVHDLDCGWMAHPFMRSRFLVRDEAQIRRIAEAGIRELFINTERGAGLAAVPEPRAGAVAGRDPAGMVVAQPSAAAPQSVAEEFREARRVHGEANRAVRDLLQDVRLGRQVSVERAEGAVEKIAGSILRNPGPLIALCRIKKKDQYTFMHSVSVGTLMMAFARAAGMDEAAVRAVGVGGLLHDVGKMTIPDEILNKPGKLSDGEFALMRSHVAAGREILEATPGLAPVSLQVVAEHHERFDGSGYPAGLKGEQISGVGQMAAIVDVYDAITSDRVYHKGLPASEGLKKILEWSSAQFNPGLVQTLIKALGIYPTGTLVMLGSGRLAVVLGQGEGSLLQPRVRVVYDTRRMSFVTPFDLDLARRAVHGEPEEILRTEPPEKWFLDPLAYLDA